MWFRYALHAIRTDALAASVADVINSKINPEDINSLIQTDKTISKISEQRNRAISYMDLVDIQHEIQLLQGQQYRTLVKIESQMASAFPEANALIASSGFFKNPPTLATERSENSEGSYDPATNQVSLNTIVFIQPGFKISTLLAHELSHVKQAEHGDSMAEIEKMNQTMSNEIDRVVAKNSGDLTTEQENRLEEFQQKNYYNQPSERQAFIQTVIGELPFSAPTNYAEFVKFLDQSGRWEFLKKYLYPENRRDMIMAIYKHYQDLRPMPSVSDSLKQESTPVSPMFAKQQTQPTLIASTKWKISKG